MKLKMRGRMWEFVRGNAGKGCVGHCDNPSKPGKRIIVSPSLTGESELDTIIHELVHAGQWDMSEEAVEEFSNDIARALWKLGYRKQSVT